MVHRDIKPANLLIPRESLAGGGPLVKLVDFGLARLHKQSAGGTIAVQTESGLLGTPDYIAPEQCRDIHAADVRSDLYSLGCTFYFVLTGRPPFDGEVAMEKLVKHLMDEPAPVERLRPGLPAALGGVVRRLMAKDPGHRYQTPAELAEALAPWCGPKGNGAGPRDGPPHFPPPVEQPDTAPEGPSTWSPTSFLPRVKVFTPEDAEGGMPAAPHWDGPDSHDTLGLPEDGPAVAVAPAATAAPPAPPAEAEGPTEIIRSAPGAASASALPRVEPALRKSWRRWARVVEALADRKAAGVSAREYRVLYAGLLAQCRAHAAAAGGKWRAFFAQAEEVVKPWMELHTLAQTEPELLRALAHRCAEVAWGLNGGRAPGNLARWAGVLLLAGCLALFLLPWRLPQVALPASGGWSKAAGAYVRSYWRHLEDHPTGWAVVAAPLVIGLSIFLITRNPRV